MRSLALPAVLVLLLGTAPSRLSAQTGTEAAGWYLIPSLSLGEEYNDNVFAEPDDVPAITAPDDARADQARDDRKREDFITHITPGLTAGYRSEPFTLLGHYSFDSEIYARNSDLTDAFARQEARLDLDYRPTRRLTLGANALYRETNNPTDFTTETTLVELGREEASEIEAAGSVAYEFDARTAGRAQYTYIRSRVTGRATNEAHEGDLGVSRELTRADQGTFDYIVRVFESEDSITLDGAGSRTGTDTTTSHTFLPGLIHQFSERTSATVKAGPRFTDDGDVDAEAELGLEHRFKRATLSLSYVRTEDFVPGEEGRVTVDRGAASVVFEPLRLLEVSVAASVANSAREDPFPDTLVYAVGVGASYRLTEWMIGRADYRFSYQEEGPATTTRNVFWLRLDLSYPIRVY